MDSEFLLWLCIGALGQLIDGAIGMGFGPIVSAVLLSLGVPPIASSTAVNAAKIATGAASAASHAWFENVDRRTFRHLTIAGMLGGLLGALVLSRIDGKAMLPFVNTYLLLLGGLILYRAFRPVVPKLPHAMGIAGTGLAAGTLNAIGGGGWGSITTAGLMGQGQSPRFAIGTANAAEFLVALVTTIAFSANFGSVPWLNVLAIIAGGFLTAPFAAWLAKHLPIKLMTVLVAMLVISLSSYGLWQYLSKLAL